MNTFIKMKILILISIILSGCMYETKLSRELPPEYFVMVRNSSIWTQERCSGFAIDNFHIITTEHCYKNQGIVDIVVTQYNQAIRVKSIIHNEELDIALLTMHSSLMLSNFPEFNNPELASLGSAYGLCNMFFYYMPRKVRHMGLLEDNEFYQKANKRSHKNITSTWITSDMSQRVCFSDSGGIILNDNQQIVGMMHSIISLPIIGQSNYLYSLNGREIENFIKENKK